ncbi:hypothetical protein, partial [Mesorhizobium sp. M4B.F.Ca.ET.017.02.2.1]|uniref:hypothetical protein n=1 Tax=Mesorhizobium sp. M4B.F.Ca.ET.017.02.2.1 TaxID=2496649 RepID=UPI001AED0EC2
MQTVWIDERLLKQRQFNMPRDHGCEYGRDGVISNPIATLSRKFPHELATRAARSRSHPDDGRELH